MDLRDVAPSARVRRAGEVMRPLRIRKDAAELGALRRAGRAVDETVAEAVGL